MPSFTIEAQGGTVPLTLESVLSTLIKASGKTPQDVKVATEQLSNWQTQSGYHSLLQDIYHQFNLDHGIRYQAIIQLKNGIDKHWRKTSVNPVGKNEKTKIRSRAIQDGISEPASQLALHNALMIAKIVRFDFPHDWPDVITTLIQCLRSSTDPNTDPRYVSNVLVMTLQIVKELGSGTLPRTRRSLQQISPELLQVIGDLYTNLISRWYHTAHALALDAVKFQTARNSYTATRIIRRLLLAGFEHPHREKEVEKLWVVLQQDANRFWSLWEDMQVSNTTLKDVLKKHLLQQSKLHLEMARSHPASFVLLPASMDILGRSWNTITLFGDNMDDDNTSDTNKWKIAYSGDGQEDASPLEKLALKALLLFRASIKMVFHPTQTFKYKHPQDKEDRKLATELVKSKVLTETAVISIMETLVTKYFILRPSDLQDWESEPDEWERREDEIGDAWEYAVRACSEKLFLDLVINFKTLLVPKLLGVFHQYATISNSDVFLKESLYSAIGIAAASLENTLDFNAVIKNNLVFEVQINADHYNLLRRRAAIVIGQWVPIKPDSLDRHTIYQIFTHLLSRGEVLNDSVVRVTAGRQLRFVLEPFEFNFDDFAPFATQLLQSLMLLIAETDLTETKMALLETVRVAVTKLGPRIEPYSEGIMSMLPVLWADSGDEHLMKQAVLTMITAIITSLGPESKRYHAAVIPLISDSVQPASEASVYLMEDGLDLWQAIIQQADIPTSQHTEDALSAQLISLCVSLLPLLDMSEARRQTLELLDSYILLSPSMIISTAFLFPLLTRIASSLEIARSSRSRDVANTTLVLERLFTILSTPNNLLDESIREEALKHLVQALATSGYLAKVFELLMEAYQYHESKRTGPPPSSSTGTFSLNDAKVFIGAAPDVIGPAESSLFSLLSRIAIADSSLFISTFASAIGLASLSPLLTEWLENFDSIGDIIQKKLQAIALTNLLRASSPPPDFILEQLQGLMAMWTDVLTELGLDAEESCEGDYLWHGPRPFENNNLAAHGDETPEDARRRVVSQIDPVNCINARKFVARRLHDVVKEIGEVAFTERWLARVDATVLEAFRTLNLL